MVSKNDENKIKVLFDKINKGEIKLESAKIEPLPKEKPKNKSERKVSNKAWISNRIKRMKKLSNKSEF